MDKIYQSLIDRNPFGGKQKDQFEDLWVPEVRGHMQDGTERSVSISTSQGPQWVGVGQMTPDGYKVLDYNAETGDTKLEYNGMQFTMPMHKSVITPTVNYNPQLTRYGNFEALTEDDAKRFAKLQEQDALIPMMGFLSDPTRVFDNKKYRDSLPVVERDPNDQFGNQPSADDDGSHPAYTFSPDVMKQMKKNYEASGNSSENVMTLKEFRDGQLNNTLKPNTPYLVPFTNALGETDFQMWQHYPPDSPEVQANISDYGE